MDQRTAGERTLTSLSYFHIYRIMEIENAVAALGALAQQSRLEVFRLLVEAGRDGLPAGQIAERLKIPAPTLSFHLSQLRHAGLVEMRRDGRSLIYAADFDGMNRAWDAWVVPGQAPARATVEARLANPAWKVEIVVTAAVG